MSSRAIAPVLGVVLLVALSAVCAGVIVIVVSDVVDMREVPRVTFEGTLNASSNEITLTHTGGDDVSVEPLEMRITVDDEPLRYQPDIPFASQTGFSTGPSGPLHAWATGTWSPSTSSSLSLSDSNEPLPDHDSTVVVSITYDNQPLADITLTQEP